MTDEEQVQQALAELWDVVKCRCHEAYTGRGLHDPDCECDSADALQAVATAITTLRAQLAEALEWNGRSAVRAEKAEDRADRAEAALAAQIEADAEICTYIIKNYDCMKADKETYQPMWVQKVAKGMVSLAQQDIRNQPHDRTALDRMLTEAREKALREAAVACDWGDIYGDNAVRTILALIEKEKTK